MSEDCGCGSISSFPNNPPIYSTVSPCLGTECEEYILSNCIKYNGPNLPCLHVTNGMLLNDILVNINNVIGECISRTYYNYIITVTELQKSGTVRYVSKTGTINTTIVTILNSPFTICAQAGTPVKIAGDCTITNSNITC